MICYASGFSGGSDSKESACNAEDWGLIPGSGRSLKSTSTMNFQMFNLDLEKADEPEIRSNCQQPLDHRKSRRIPEKHLLLLCWLCQSLYCVDHNKLWKISQEMGIPDHLTCLLRNLYIGQEETVRTRHGKQTGSKLGKEYIKAVYCHSAYLTYMPSASCEIWPVWITSWNQDCQEKYQ